MDPTEITSNRNETNNQASLAENVPEASSSDLDTPNVSTHVIEGHVIQESDQPFPVKPPVYQWPAAFKEYCRAITSPNPDRPLNENSMSPARSVASSEWFSENSTSSGIPVSKWTVTQVYEFIRNVPGCSGYADQFLYQKVDGEALLLMKCEDLVEKFSMKQELATTVISSINSLCPDDEESDFYIELEFCSDSSTMDVD
ncbi:polyhomeotic-like protein 2 [Battus philenor]|uniref:polyhomeotic-like protein 2 n=1 Tax=Battus philenor TaxID=42288 RepID=UPI0035D0D95E